MCKKCGVPKVCKWEDGCDKMAVAHGYCKTHYYAMARRPDNPFNRPICNAPNCTNPVYAKELCVKHAAKLRRTGTLAPLYNGRSVCRIDGCGRIVRSDNLCGRCLRRREANGSPYISQKNYERKDGDEFQRRNGKKMHVYVKMGGHPLADRHGIVAKARMILFDAGMLGPREVVGFKDGNSLNCDIRNLFITTKNRSKRLAKCEECKSKMVTVLSYARRFCSLKCWKSHCARHRRTWLETAIPGDKRQRTLCVRDIMLRRIAGSPYKTIAEEMNVGYSTVFKLCNGTHHLSDQSLVARCKAVRVPKKIERLHGDIVEAARAGEAYRSIGIRLGVHPSVIGDVARRYGVKRNLPASKRKQQVAVVRSMRRHGRTWADISKAVGLSSTTVCRLYQGG